MDLITELRKIPSVTRFLTGSLVGVTLPLIMGMISYRYVLYTSSRVFSYWEVSYLCLQLFG